MLVVFASAFLQSERVFWFILLACAMCAVGGYCLKYFAALSPLGYWAEEEGEGAEGLRGALLHVHRASIARMRAQQGILSLRPAATTLRLGGAAWGCWCWVVCALLCWCSVVVSGRVVSV